MEAIRAGLQSKAFRAEELGSASTTKGVQLQIFTFTHSQPIRVAHVCWDTNTGSNILMDETRGKHAIKFSACSLVLANLQL